MPKEDPFVNRAQLLKAIKKYPEIWDSNNKLHMCRSVTAPMWNEIADQFGGHVPTVKLQSIWSQMKYHYHNLVHRQILHKERFTTKWEHFDPMSFMYNITVAKIVGAASTDPNQTAAAAAAAAQSPTSLQHSPPAVPPLPQTQGRGRPSGSFTWLPQAPTHTEVVSVETTPFTGFTGLVPPAAITVETMTSPMQPRKPGRPGSLNNSMRGRIIDAIKMHPILWAGRQREQRQGQNRTSAVWKEVAAELALTPSLVQTRWSIIKQRYVDELQKERHAQYTQQGFHSSWEHFERMAFMREILAKKVDEREQTREHIQEIVSEQQQLQTQHLRYVRPGSVVGVGPTAGVPSMGLSPGHHPHHPHSHPHHQLVSAHHHSLAVCDEGDVVGMVPSVHGLGRRRVKTEADLEWDPFEMILQVHGTEPAVN